MPTLLVLGGTRFVGRAVVAEAVARGWHVTTCNRGTRPAPDGVEQLTVDRLGDGLTGAVADRRWDLALDTWADAASVVDDAARALAGRVERLAYVSSRSVYAFPPPAGADESAPTVRGDRRGPADASYAARKAGGEAAALASFPDALLLRAGLVLGPWEDVGRLPWWLDRVAAGGPVPAPGPADLPLQYVDARDLAAFALTALADGLVGPHDVVAPSGHTTTRGLLQACVAATGADATLRWVSPEQVAAAGVAPWTDLPVWTPPGELHDALHRSDPSRALAAGLRPRPVADTVAATWAWLQEAARPAQRPDRPAHGLTAAQDRRLLELAAD